MFEKRHLSNINVVVFLEHTRLSVHSEWSEERRVSVKVSLVRKPMESTSVEVNEWSDCEVNEMFVAKIDDEEEEMSGASLVRENWTFDIYRLEDKYKEAKAAAEIDGNAIFFRESVVFVRFR